MRILKLAIAAVSFSVALVVAAVPTALAEETRGRGGAYNDRTNQTFTASNGLSSRYHVYAAGVPQDHAAGLVLQFHGDGAYEFNNPTSTYSLGGANGIIAQARGRGYITVPVLAPDRVGSVTWWENGAANADFVAELVDSLKAAYNLDTEDIWLVGYSGGAQFITQFYLPRHSAQIDGGGAVVFGGGGSPRVTARPFAPDLVRDFPMHWYVGALDTGPGFNALAAARSGASWYAQRGFVTDLEVPSGVGHNLSGRFGTVLAGHLDAHPASGTTPAPTTPAPTTPAPTPPAPTPPAPTTPAPTPPIPRPTTAPTSPTSWSHRIEPTCTGAEATVTIPRGTRRTTFRATTLDGRQYWYRYTTGTGVRTLTLSSLESDTAYRYTLVADGVTVASGSFRTLGAQSCTARRWTRESGRGFDPGSWAAYSRSRVGSR
ncbi:hypothetical protein [Granulicoccus sp. GXG6511]|uniref:hypothetical protein n=1 Tax=Granulicoccus sp. GXG6511 TaxID=3381351 RepID=UPI003D7EFBE9